MSRYWRCPSCHREREDHGELMKVCACCCEQMEIKTELREVAQ